MAETQKACQKYQTQTTTNINKLAEAIDKLTKEAMKLETSYESISVIEGRVSSVKRTLEQRIERVENAYATWTKVVYGTIFAGILGVIFKYVGA